MFVHSRAVARAAATLGQQRKWRVARGRDRGPNGRPRGGH